MIIIIKNIIFKIELYGSNDNKVLNNNINKKDDNYFEKKQKKTK